jgi:hypothetical protein
MQFHFNLDDDIYLEMDQIESHLEALTRESESASASRKAQPASSPPSLAREGGRGGGGQSVTGGGAAAIAPTSGGYGGGSLASKIKASAASAAKCPGVHAADSGEGLETVELMTSGAAVGALAQLAQV